MRLLYWLFGLSVKSVQIRPSYNSHLNYFVLYQMYVIKKRNWKRSPFYILTNYSIFITYFVIFNTHIICLWQHFFVFKIPPVVRPVSMSIVVWPESSCDWLWVSRISVLLWIKLLETASIIGLYGYIIFV